MTGTELRAWRKRMGFKSTEVASRFGVSADTWTRWEQKAKLPTYVALACAAVAFGLPPLER